MAHKSSHVILLSLGMVFFSGCSQLGNVPKAVKSLAVSEKRLIQLSRREGELIPRTKGIKNMIPKKSLSMRTIAEETKAMPRARPEDPYTPISDVPLLSTIPIGIVRARVKTFRDRFRRGASNPEMYLSRLRQEHPELSEWFNTPVQNRIFLTGSGKDEDMIKAFSAEKRKIGLTTFFYKDCKPLCSDEEVGAMFSSSGESGLWYDWHAMESIFIEAELDTIRSLIGLKPGKSRYIRGIGGNNLQDDSDMSMMAASLYSASKIAPLLGGYSRASDQQTHK